MSSGGVADNAEEELPSTVGAGWLQISVDDPERDKRLIINNLMRELCQMDQQARQNQEIVELAIEDIGSLRAFESKYIEGFLKPFENEKHYIQINPIGKISLTDLGR